MLKKTISQIKHKLVIGENAYGGNSGSSSSYYQPPAPYCYDKVVPDEAAMSRCYSLANIKIDGIKRIRLRIIRAKCYYR